MDIDSSIARMLGSSGLPFGAPDFGAYVDDHFQPAIEAGMRLHLAEIRRIADNAAAPTFDNTVEALERSGAGLARVHAVFSALTAANTNAVLQAAEMALAPQLAAHDDAIYLDAVLFERITLLHAQRNALGLDAEQCRLLEHYHRRFVQAGAELPESDKETLRQLNQEESTLAAQFGNALLRADTDGALRIADTNRLEGLDAEQMSAAETAAAARGFTGEWILPLHNTTQQPMLANLRSRALRLELLQASLTRAERGDDNDTRAHVQRLAQIRAQKAALLGFPSYAHYRLCDQMAATPEAAQKLLTDTVSAAVARVREESARIQALIVRDGAPFEVSAADWLFYAERVRQAEYDLDDTRLKPYFELERVLRDGVFYAAERLYGIQLRERDDVPVYHPDVQVFDVLDDDQQLLALFYFDPFKRANKHGGAWMGHFVEQNGLTGARPIVYNVANIAKPAAGMPVLLTCDEIITLFHEFGHALHGVCSKTRYPSLSGTRVPHDFVEFPSQFNEHWASEPEVLAHYARHHVSGDPLSASDVEKIRRAQTFNQGYATTEYLAAALLDLAWHMLPADAPLQDIAAFEKATLQRFGVDLDVVPPRYRTSYFSHIWGGGYAAGYYAYFWAEVLDHDTYDWFVENGGLTRANGQRFREAILAIGNSRDLMEAYRSLRGRDPDVGPLLKQRGLRDDSDRQPMADACCGVRAPS